MKGLDDTPHLEEKETLYWLLFDGINGAMAWCLRHWVPNPEVLSCYAMWNLFTVGSLQFCKDYTIASLEANQV